MAGLLDHLVAAVAARVAGHRAVLVVQGDAALVGAQHERAAGDVERHRVGVAVKAHQAVAAQEVLQALADREAQVEHARVPQHHHEAAQRPARAVDRERAKAAPVHLCLLARLGLAPHEGRVRPGAQRRDRLLEHAVAALKTLLAQLGQQAHGRELRQLAQPRPEVLQVGRDLRWPRRPPVARRYRSGQRPRHGLSVQLHARRDVL